MIGPLNPPATGNDSEQGKGLRPKFWKIAQWGGVEDGSEGQDGESMGV